MTPTKAYLPHAIHGYKAKIRLGIHISVKHTSKDNEIWQITSNYDAKYGWDEKLHLKVDKHIYSLHHIFVMCWYM